MANGNRKGSLSFVVLNYCGRKRVDLEDVPISESIGDFKVRYLNEMAKKQATSDIKVGVEKPESLALSVDRYIDGKVSSRVFMSEDDTQSIGKFLEDAGYEDDYISSQLDSYFEISMVPDWYRYLKKMYDFNSDGEEIEYQECPDVDEIVNRKRPEDLAENIDVLRVVGELDVYYKDKKDGNVKYKPVGYLGGLGCALKDVVKITTPAEHVLLVPQGYNLQLLEDYYWSLAKDITTFIIPQTKLLVLLVTWDKFSYLFLRMLRKSIGSEKPIVAFTDAEVYQLDLLAFLDTPPQHLAKLYGWDLSQDCTDLGIGPLDVVDIKWAGLRPSENICLSRAPPNCEYAGTDYLFDKICGFLLEKQEKWHQEVQHFKERKFCLPLRCCAASKSKYDLRPKLGEYISQKLDNRDWI